MSYRDRYRILKWNNQQRVCKVKWDKENVLLLYVKLYENHPTNVTSSHSLGRGDSLVLMVYLFIQFWAWSPTKDAVTINSWSSQRYQLPTIAGENNTVLLLQGFKYQLIVNQTASRAQFSFYSIVCVIFSKWVLYKNICFGQHILFFIRFLVLFHGFELYINHIKLVKYGCKLFLLKTCVTYSCFEKCMYWTNISNSFY